MSTLALSAVVSFLLALLLGASAVLAPVPALHLAFAVGVLPLIFGAMLHFVPVLTRTGSPHRLIASLPFAAQATGILVVLGLQGILPRVLLHPAATMDLLLALTLLGWIVHRSRRTLGSPHPGWRWYAASLVLLILALLAVPLLLAGIVPAAMRGFHLHANTLGFIGLAALGTLPVLMPTVLGRGDPQAAPWLRRHLPFAAAAVLLLASGVALWWPFSLIGGALLLMVVASLLRHWQRSVGFALLLGDGAATSLFAALIGYFLLLLSGLAHASGVIHTQGVVFAFAAGFLLPLVTGALAQLLPVWRFPGMQTPARVEMRKCMVRFGRWRALIFPVAGLSFMFGTERAGAVGVACALVLFFVDLLQALRVPPSAR